MAPDSVEVSGPALSSASEEEVSSELPSVSPKDSAMVSESESLSASDFLSAEAQG